MTTITPKVGRVWWLARVLLLFTIVYNVAEGVIAIVAGIQAGSLALMAFGADSYLEVAAASAVLWRLLIADEERGERAEQRAMRFIGWTFLALAAAIVYQATVSLAGHHGAEESPVGIGLALASVTMMPALSLWKLKTAADGNIVALAAEAKETLACSYLSVTLLAGLVANAVLGWWWLDPATALLLVPWLVREGLEGVHGDVCFEDLTACFCRRCLYGVRTCKEACCVTAYRVA
ncbi:MAG: cobalt transporter [Dehalococcoidia bacterium]